MVLDVEQETVTGDHIDTGGEVCAPECEGKECGLNGCGGSCGACNGMLEQCSDEGRCEPFHCESTKDCPGTLVCDLELGICVICVGDEDCLPGEVCGADLECHEQVPCTSDKDCKADAMICDKEAGFCVECLASADCEDDLYCLDGYCLEDVCDAGEARCDGQDVVFCNEEGSAEEVTETCDDTQYCEDGVCLDQLCAPGVSFCEGDLLHTCDDTGNAILSTVDCEADGLYCHDGACVDQECEPSTSWCEDDFTAAACAADGKSHSIAPCPAGFYCEGGTCKPQVCEPGSEGCEGDLAYLCDSKGSGYATSMDCSEWQMTCADGGCVDCTAECEEKECGDDGCGGTCGSCLPSDECVDGVCQPGWGGTWVPIPGGAFMMGCSPGDTECEQNEQPPHAVDVAPFLMLETEVTVAQWATVVPENPAPSCVGGIGPNTPVECVTWSMANTFCQAVGGRLPTEAEWEYAARAGTTTKYPCGSNVACLDDVAWIGSNAVGHKHDVRQKEPNAFGLYDMIGNVVEWTEDWFHDGYDGAPGTGYPAWTSPEGNSRVSRGCSFSPVCVDEVVRVSARGSGNPESQGPGGGFRCARSY